MERVEKFQLMDFSVFSTADNVQSVDKKSIFEVAIDAFKANSGSPVSNKITKKAIGILVGGNRDYNLEAREGVTVYHQLTEEDIRKRGFEKCQKISAISKKAIDKIMCANYSQMKETIIEEKTESIYLSALRPPMQQPLVHTKPLNNQLLSSTVTIKEMVLWYYSMKSKSQKLTENQTNYPSINHPSVERSPKNISASNLRPSQGGVCGQTCTIF